MKSKTSIDWPRLGRELRSDRDEVGRTFRDTARLAGVSLAAYQRAEAGRPLDSHNFILLCEWIDADPRSFWTKGK